MLQRIKRSPLLRGAALVGILVCGVTAAWAAQQAGGRLFPNWSPPTKGTYQAPADTIGKKPAGEQPWSVTTVASSIKGETVPGKPVSVVGEIVDLSCYLQVGKHGDKHRDCGQKCARNGQPLGLLTADGGVYMLIDEEHDPRRDGLTDLRKQLIDQMAHVVTVHGTVTEVAGQKALYVQGSVARK